MNKIKLTNRVSEISGLSKKDSKTAVDAVLEAITESLQKKEQVALVGFGTFSVAERAARTAKVPGTDKTVDVEAKTVAKFKAGKILKLKVTGK